MSRTIYIIGTFKALNLRASVFRSSIRYFYPMDTVISNNLKLNPLKGYVSHHECQIGYAQHDGGDRTRFQIAAESRFCTNW